VRARSARLWRSVTLTARILIVLIIFGSVLPHLVARTAERLFPLRSVLARAKPSTDDVGSQERLTAFWRLLAWLREFYAGGD